MDSINKKYLVFDVETTGLRGVESKITCICAKDNEGDWFKGAGEDEAKIVNDFLDWLNKKEFNLFVSANGKDFDIPFLMIRGAYFCNILPEKFYKFTKEHFDIINDITSYRISLDNLARILGFNLKTGNGLKAIQLYNEGKYSELVNYCMNDVILTEKVYLKLLELKR
jgi:uncharacterized protein YprB with RNaseH-like and TPR domain